VSRFRVHPQLLQDCHQLGRMAACHALLHRNAVLPWFILIPETDEIDLLDLDPALRNRVMDEATAISRFVKDELQCPKVNVAAIGNLVPQLHLHVIGRHPGDACWPLPVWGHLQESDTYSEPRLEEIGSLLEGSWGLQRSA